MNATAQQNSSKIIASLLLPFLMVLGGGSIVAQEEAEDPVEQETAQETAAPDTSQWVCESCPFNYGLVGSIYAGTGYVSDELAEFGSFRGLDDDGFFADLGLDLQWRAENGNYFRARGERLGLDSRDLFIEGGRQGTYKLWLGYDEIAFYRDFQTRTIFQGAGTADQRLPADWIRGGSSPDLPRLDDNLSRIRLGHDRESLTLGFSVQKHQPWRYGVEVERTTRDGTRQRGASFIFHAAEIAAPIDEETIQVNASLGYVQRKWEVQLGYDLSLFDNRNRAVRFENPFLGINGADVGELALPPDNRFHQVSLSGSWRARGWLTLIGQVAFGRAEQDERFLAPTLNPNIFNPGLPRADLDGEVDTRIINLRAVATLTRKLRGTIQFDYDERDNQTPRDSFVQVVADTFVIDPRINNPFSYERIGFNASLDYRLSSMIRLDASFRYRETERTFQEVEDTDTTIWRARARTRPTDKLGVILEVSREDRNNDLDPTVLDQLENPQLRRFHFAEKQRDFIRVSADYQLPAGFVAGAYYELADEEFNDTRIGLSDARDERYGVNLSGQLGSRAVVHAFFDRESLEADILGADNVTGTPWQARQDDIFRTFGVGLQFTNLPGKWLDARLDFTQSRADGELSIVKRGASMPDFPDLETDRYTLEASVDRQLKQNWNLRLGWLMEKFSDSDFFRDVVDPGNVPLLLSLAQRSPNETVHVVSARLRYQFR